MNRFRVTKQFFFALLCILFVACSPALNAANDFPMLSEEDYKALSPAERQDYEARLKTHIEQMSPAEQEAFMQQEIEKLYQSLPPEQQKEVLEEAARIEKMSPAEQEAYFKQVEQELEDMFGQQQGQTPVAQPQEKAPVQEELIPDEPKKKEVSAPQISEEEKALKEAVTLINEIGQAMDDLSTKMESMVNLQFKFSSWGKKKKIGAWDGGFEWKKLKEKISTFRGQLEKLKDRDTVTKKHKYLPHLLENKALYNQLYNLSVDLAEQEPTVRGGTNESVTPQIRARSNKAIRALIKSFVDLLYGKSDIITSLNTLFTKFDPEAKKIAGKETKATQKALAESRQPVSSSSVKVVGSSRERDSYRSGYGDDYSQMGREYGAGTPSAYPSSYGSQYGTPYGSNDYKGIDQTSAGKAGTGESAPKGKSEGSKAPEVKDARMDKLLKKFDQKVEVIVDEFSEVGQFKEIAQYVRIGKVDINFAQKHVADLKSDLHKATVALNGIMDKLKTMPSAAKASYKKEITNTIDNIYTDVEKLRSDLNGVTAASAGSEEMKYAHFGEEPKDREAIITKGAAPQAQSAAKLKAKVFSEIETPTPLPELRKEADNFLKKVQEFKTIS